MRRYVLAIAALLALNIATIASAAAQDRERNRGRAEETAASQQQPSRATTIAPVSTEHKLALPSGAIDYRAVVETLPIVDGKGATTAQVAVIAYLAGGADARTRPVTFVFNGGPGVSSAFLQFGALGPKVLVTGPGGTIPVPPARLQDNPDSWLAFTDLVFVDPVGTGFSRATKPDENADRAFWSVSSDARSLSELIRLWLTRNARWPSPKFIAGESYGGYRGVQIARRLLDDQGVALNGLIMVSPALEFSTISPGQYNPLPWALALPSLVASARAQDKGDASMPLDQVEHFALTDYLTGIAAIDPPGPGPTDELIDSVTKLLGLKPDLVRRHHGRVPASVFSETLLEGTGLTLSLYDGAFAAPDPEPGRRGDDPLLTAIKAPLSTAYNAYVRDELKLETDAPFLLLNPETSRHWDWEGARGGRGRGNGAMDALAETLALTPGMRVLVVHGRTDMVTPYMASLWLLDRLDLPKEVRDRVQLAVLKGGHMMYLDGEQRHALNQLAAELYRN